MSPTAKDVQWCVAFGLTFCKRNFFGTSKNQKRKFTKQVLVRALEATPGWIDFFLQETAQTFKLNHDFLFFYIIGQKNLPDFSKK